MFSYLLLLHTPCHLNIILERSLNIMQTLIWLIFLWRILTSPWVLFLLLDWLVLCLIVIIRPTFIPEKTWFSICPLTNIFFNYTYSTLVAKHVFIVMNLLVLILLWTENVNSKSNFLCFFIFNIVGSYWLLLNSTNKRCIESTIIKSRFFDFTQLFVIMKYLES